MLKMKLRDICQKVKDGEFQVDYCGHTTSNYERILSTYDDYVANESGAHDGKWTYNRKDETPAEIDAGMREHFSNKLDRNYEENEGIYDFCRLFCFKCGRELNWAFNNNKLSLKCYFDPKISDFAFLPKCEYKNIKMLSGKIKVESPLYIANFFPDIEDVPEDEKYTAEWSLNSLAGRKRITEYKAQKLNVAYGQMSNMSIGVFEKQSKNLTNSIIIGNPWSSDEDMDEIKGHKSKGRICCDVWRWEAADEKTIRRDGVDGVAQLKEEHESRGNQFYVKLNAQHGIWEFKHYFDCDRDKNPKIYSTLKLVD